MRLHVIFVESLTFIIVSEFFNKMIQEFKINIESYNLVQARTIIIFRCKLKQKVPDRALNIK